MGSSPISATVSMHDICLSGFGSCDCLVGFGKEAANDRMYSSLLSRFAVVSMLEIGTSISKAGRIAAVLCAKLLSQESDGATSARFITLR